MAILPIDSGRYGTKEMLAIFSEQKKIDYQLEIEAAAALSQSEIKIISRNVANDIAKNRFCVLQIFRKRFRFRFTH